MSLRTVGLLIAAIFIAVAIAVGLRAVPDGGKFVGTAHYSGKAIAFDYPAALYRHSYTKESSFSSSIVFLSTARMHNPCVVTKRANGTETSCGLPVDQLEPGGVLIEWSANGFPGVTVDGQGPGGTTIAGRPATLHEEKPGDCEYLGADMTIYADVSRDAAGDNWYEMRACLKGPNLDELRRQISSMLTSLEVQKEPSREDILGLH